MFLNVPSAFMNSSGQYENPPFLSSSGPQVACSPGRCRLMTERIPHLKTVQKVWFYIAHVSSPLDRTKDFTLHPLADLFIPTPTRLLREEFSHAAITHEDDSLTFPPLSIAMYSFIQLSELGHCGENENAHETSKW